MLESSGFKRIKVKEIKAKTKNRGRLREIPRKVVSVRGNVIGEIFRKLWANMGVAYNLETTKLGKYAASQISWIQNQLSLKGYENSVKGRELSRSFKNMLHGII